MTRYSGLQISVLSLYREFLRHAKKSNNPQMKVFITQEFRENATKISKRSIQLIEWKIRVGKEKLEQLQASQGVTFIKI